MMKKKNKEPAKNLLENKKKEKEKGKEQVKVDDGIVEGPTREESDGELPGKSNGEGSIKGQASQEPSGAEEVEEAEDVEKRGNRRVRRKAKELVRLYDCPVRQCGKAYTALKNLNAHISTKHPGTSRQRENQAIRRINRSLRAAGLPSISKKKVGAENTRLNTFPKKKLLGLIQSMKAMALNMFKLKVELLTLEGLHPTWRTVLVPKDFTLDLVHPLLQVLFGWLDQFPHVFKAADGRLYSVHAGVLAQNPVEDGSNVSLEMLLPTIGSKLSYEYRLDDTGWKQEITLLDKTTAASLVPRCLDGAGASPPEGCNGARGYADALALLSQRGNFDASVFDVATANLVLSKTFQEDPV